MEDSPPPPAQPPRTNSIRSKISMFETKTSPEADKPAFLVPRRRSRGSVPVISKTEEAQPVGLGSLRRVSRDSNSAEASPKPPVGSVVRRVSQEGGSPQGDTAAAAAAVSEPKTSPPVKPRRSSSFEARLAAAQQLAGEAPRVSPRQPSLPAAGKVSPRQGPVPLATTGTTAGFPGKAEQPEGSSDAVYGAEPAGSQQQQIASPDSSRQRSTSTSDPTSSQAPPAAAINGAAAISSSHAAGKQGPEMLPEPDSTLQQSAAEPSVQPDTAADIAGHQAGRHASNIEENPQRVEQPQLEQAGAALPRSAAVLASLAADQPVSKQVEQSGGTQNRSPATGLASEDESSIDTHLQDNLPAAGGADRHGGDAAAAGMQPEERSSSRPPTADTPANSSASEARAPAQHADASGELVDAADAETCAASQASPPAHHAFAAEQHTEAARHAAPATAQASGLGVTAMPAEPAVEQLSAAADPTPASVEEHGLVGQHEQRSSANGDAVERQPAVSAAADQGEESISDLGRHSSDQACGPPAAPQAAQPTSAADGEVRDSEARANPQPGSTVASLCQGSGVAEKQAEPTDGADVTADALAPSALDGTPASSRPDSAVEPLYETDSLELAASGQLAADTAGARAVHAEMSPNTAENDARQIDALVAPATPQPAAPGSSQQPGGPVAGDSTAAGSDSFDAPTTVQPTSAQTAAGETEPIGASDLKEDDDFGDFSDVGAAAQSTLSQPVAKVVLAAAAEADDGEKGFGDFADAVAPTEAESTPSQPIAKAALEAAAEDDDGFGDFSDAAAAIQPTLVQSVASSVPLAAAAIEGDDDDDGFGDFNDADADVAFPATQHTVSTAAAVAVPASLSKAMSSAGQQHSSAAAAAATPPSDLLALSGSSFLEAARKLLGELSPNVAGPAGGLRAARAQHHKLLSLQDLWSAGAPTPDSMGSSRFMSSITRTKGPADGAAVNGWRGSRAEARLLARLGLTQVAQQAQEQARAAALRTSSRLRPRRSSSSGDLMQERIQTVISGSHSFTTVSSYVPSIRVTEAEELSVNADGMAEAFPTSDVVLDLDYFNHRSGPCTPAVSAPVTPKTSPGPTEGPEPGAGPQGRVNAPTADLSQTRAMWDTPGPAQVASDAFGSSSAEVQSAAQRSSTFALAPGAVVTAGDAWAGPAGAWPGQPSAGAGSLTGGGFSGEAFGSPTGFRSGDNMFSVSTAGAAGPAATADDFADFMAFRPAEAAPSTLNTASSRQAAAGVAAAASASGGFESAQANDIADFEMAADADSEPPPAPSLQHRTAVPAAEPVFEAAWGEFDSAGPAAAGAPHGLVSDSSWPPSLPGTAPFEGPALSSIPAGAASADPLAASAVMARLQHQSSSSLGKTTSGRGLAPGSPSRLARNSADEEVIQASTGLPEESSAADPTAGNQVPDLSFMLSTRLEIPANPFQTPAW